MIYLLNDKRQQSFWRSSETAPFFVPAATLAMAAGDGKLSRAGRHLPERALIFPFAFYGRPVIPES